MIACSCSPACRSRRATERSSWVRLIQERLGLYFTSCPYSSSAIQFTDKGRVTVRAKVVEGLNPGTEHFEPLVEVSVTDTGMGIPPERQVDIFREFTQVDDSDSRRVGGAGLGLPIARKLVELHGGRMWVESTVGAGSTFTFVLPLSHAELAEELATGAFR